MPVKTPDFWHRSPGILALLLTPIAWIYQGCHRLVQLTSGKTYKSSIPVICVGNAVAGGGGKTPTTIALVKIIKENNIAKNPIILTRGYGSNIKTPTIVTSSHSSEDVGDESIILARHATIIIAPDRAEGARLAETHGADLIIMDDGLLNNSLKKDLNFLVIDRTIDFGNGKTIPAGPLREPLSKILPKIDAVICIGRPLQSEKIVFEASVEVTSMPDSSKNYIAFAGIAYPHKFKKSLEEKNLNVVGWHEFPDHHDYSTKELENLQKEALEKNATLITTEKDYVRLNSDFAKNIETLPIEIIIHNIETLVSYMQDSLK